jgi:UDPglucose 6-dehydrogenase
LKQKKIVWIVIILSFSFFNVAIFGKKIVVIGAGYVGLVASGGLASLGHEVICVDNDDSKIADLNKGIIPIYEPGLRILLIDMMVRHRLSFTASIEKAIYWSDVIMITVGTPMAENGIANLTALDDVIQKILLYVTKYTIVCIKSTVPIGTSRVVKEKLQETISGKFDLVFNPEFLREGSALFDFFKNNPIVVGTESEQALTIMKEIYAPMIEKGTELIITTPSTAEMIKYAWNCYSAIKISYVNQLSHVCNRVGADIKSVVRGISFSDTLLPISAITPGPGIGGSCLPKDTQAFISMASSYGCDMDIVRVAMESNKRHTQKIISKLYDLLENRNRQGITVAILGLSFKPNTDDIRYSPAIPIFEKLLYDGITIHAYDPQAMANMRKLFPQVTYFDSAYEALKDVNAVVLLTDWDECKQIKTEIMACLVKERIVIDTRNMWDPQELKRHNFVYYNLGRI